METSELLYSRARYSITTSHHSSMPVAFTRFVFWCLFSLLATPIFSQKFLVLETRGRVKTRKIEAGAVLNYRIKDGQGWYTSELVDINPRDSLLIMPNKSWHVKEIAALRYPKRGPKGIGTSLKIFGLSWSANQLLGTLTDNDPSTRYQSGDAILTASTVGVGYLLPALIKFREFEMGKKHRLKVIDTRPGDVKY
jgi:hypothetical protein